jgi:lipopolysaccharide export system permease protein
MSNTPTRAGIPMFQTWYRYFFFRFFFLVTTLTLLTFCLFVMADVLSHIKDILDPTTTWKTWRTYYLCLLFYRLDVLIPFSIATATSLLLPRLLRNNEFIPLMNAGLSLSQIIMPFIAVTILASSLLWINGQWIYPRAIAQYHRIVKSDFGREALSSDPTRLGMVLFKGGSRLFFNVHNPRTYRIDDAFWVRSTDCIVHIEKLFYFKDRLPEGHGVDVIERDKDGTMKKTASYQFCELSELQFTKETVRTSTTDPKELSISQLASLAKHFGSSRSLRATETSIALLLKLLSPLLAWLAFLFPAPFCLRFEYRLPQALLVFLSLATLFCFHLVVQASMILARTPVFGSALIMLLPWAIALLYTFRKIRTLA